jgi:hypothetical protein
MTPGVRFQVRRAPGFLTEAAMLKRIEEGSIEWNAALRFVGLSKEELPAPCRVDLSRMQIVITCPDGAAVERAEGSLGEGYEPKKLPSVVTLPAALLFIGRRAESKLSDYALWSQCIRDAEALKPKPETVQPHDALQALRDFQNKIPKDQLPKEKTDHERPGFKGIQIAVQRMTMKDHTERVTSRMVRKAHA